MVVHVGAATLESKARIIELETWLYLEDPAAFPKITGTLKIPPVSMLIEVCILNFRCFQSILLKPSM
jgi:hypothetical protein